MIGEVTRQMVEMLFSDGVGFTDGMGVFYANEYIVSMLPFLGCMFVVGGIFGVLLMACMNASASADRHLEMRQRMKDLINEER